ncbi:MAG: helicase-related protein [Gammaproteobacteria bacterium]|nr:helicase-related protein [Gammaproteobacteria bacterium]
MAPQTDTIVDNRNQCVGNYLKERIEPGARLSIVSAYFTIYAYHALRKTLEDTGNIRFLYGDPRGVSDPDPGDEESKSFRLTDDDSIILRHALALKPLAKECADWIDKKVEIKTVTQANFLHGKLYHVAGETRSSALVGSSNFTRRGLGLGKTPNIELNIVIENEVARDSLIDWFDDLWNDNELTRDAKDEVLSALERLGRPWSPEFVYYKTLFHIFEDRLNQQNENDKEIKDINLESTKIWKALYAFQREGARSVINRLKIYNGAIIADSVGLGKTWTALAIVKYFELLNEKVLVLCPKKLEENWIRYTSLANRPGNPFDEDRMGYTVLAHTDLSRERGNAGYIDLAHFNWSSFGLVVIDESHNFRNQGQDKKDENGNQIRMSRYNKLIKNVIGSGVRTKVLMLSATPVNTSLRDLRNQIYLMTGNSRNAFRKSLGISDIQILFGNAEKKFKTWEKKNRREEGVCDKNELLEDLGTDFLTLLDAVTIARSRKHICNFYPEETESIGGFPQRSRPVNLSPRTDTKDTLSYEKLHEMISGFHLAIYRPSSYLKNEEIEGQGTDPFKQRDRERWLVGMMRTNLLKRLESSIHAYRLTVGRMLENMTDIDYRIKLFQKEGIADPGSNGILATIDEDDENSWISQTIAEDEEFVIGKNKQYSFNDINITKWQKDLEKDRETFQYLLAMAEPVLPDRDAKLAELRKILCDKIVNPTCNRKGELNQKALVFTAFADTAYYLYENLKDKIPDADLGLITGSGDNRSTVGFNSFTEILACFAPKAQDYEMDPDIDILIATDCLSEGQNLQDCDLVINYDIHWNPVRLMQRFGRIDRLGSQNDLISMVNFWPTKDLETYLNLQNRVEARMALADAAGTGSDDLLEDTRTELRFRDEQLKRLREETLDIEDSEDNVTLSDLTLDDFIADLLRYLESNRKELEMAPIGICSITDTEIRDNFDIKPPLGTIFCLRHKTPSTDQKTNVLQPYFLVYLNENGNIHCGFRKAKQCLNLFARLSLGYNEANKDLEDIFANETDQGKKMEKYEHLLELALEDIKKSFQKASLNALANSSDGLIPMKSEQPEEQRDFELITWLVIKSKEVFDV